MRVGGSTKTHCQLSSNSKKRIDFSYFSKTDKIDQYLSEDLPCYSPSKLLCYSHICDPPCIELAADCEVLANE